MTFYRSIPTVIPDNLAYRSQFLTMFTPVFICMKVDIYSFFAEHSKPVKTIYHSAIIRGIGDIQSYDMKVFFQKFNEIWKFIKVNI